MTDTQVVERRDSTPLLIADPWAVETPDDRPFSKDPSVIRFRDAYWMYFSLPPVHDQVGAWHIGVARSTDLRVWKHVGTLVPDGEAEARGLAAPGAVVLDGVVHIFYQSYGTLAQDSICHATSTDGLTFERDPSNPVFRPEGSWNCGRAIDADVIVDGSRLLMGYATRDPEMKVQMLGTASAHLGSGFGRGTWTDLSLDGPALRPELAWELECIEAPTFTRRDGKLVMFYAGGYNNEPQQIGWATSPDGVHWTRGEVGPLIPHGPRGAWNSSESGHPGIFQDEDGITYLFFQGNDSGSLKGDDEGKRTNLLAATRIEWDGIRPVVTSAGS